MLTAICIAAILLLASIFIFAFAAVVILGRILLYLAIAVAIGCFIKWIFD